MAAFGIKAVPSVIDVSTHSHPKVAATDAANLVDGSIVSTHSHPKVAACGKR